MGDADVELFNNLCEELLSEVLVRLSSKAAFRFQVVCKRWYSLLSSPYFIHLRHHTAAVQSRCSLVIQNTYWGDSKFHSDFQIISDDDDDCSSSRKAYVESVSFVPCSPIDRHNVELEASFADLILCSYITHYVSNLQTRQKQINYYVSNLQTRQWVALPPPPAEMAFVNGVAIGFLCVPPPCSKCNCKPVDKFLVVRLGVSEPFSAFKVQVFSSDDSSVWRSLVVSFPPDFKFSTAMTSLVAYRGMLHWLNTDCILVYDPLNTPQTFSRIIHLPIQSPLYHNHIGRSWCFQICQARLRLVLDSAEDDDAGDPVVVVWELGEYDSGLWNLVHKVYLKDVAYNIRLPITRKGSFVSTLCPFSIVSLHSQNGDVVYLRVNNGVVSVNMKTRMVERFYQGNGILAKGRLKAFPLADQWWPTPLSCTKHM